MDYITALQSALLARDVYEDFSKITFSDWDGVTPKLIKDDNTDTQLAILEDSTTQQAIIVFRGSSAIKDWRTNLKLSNRTHEWFLSGNKEEGKKEIEQQSEPVSKTVGAVNDMDATVVNDNALIYPTAYGDPSNPVRMHRGFVSAYLSVRDRIHEYVTNSQATQYRIVGHSLGGALAKLCAVDLDYNFGKHTEGKKIEIEAYTFGAPKVGNKAFVDSYNARVPNTYRIVNGWDAVPNLLRMWQGYRHTDKLVQLKRSFSVRLISKRIKDHLMDSYISALQAELGRQEQNRESEGTTRPIGLVTQVLTIGKSAALR